MLEVVAVSGVVHLGQIQTGLRYAKRIAQVCFIRCVILFYLKAKKCIILFYLKTKFQGGHVKIHLTNEVPVQVDGEPWVQGPGELVILKSALKVCNSIVFLNI